MPYMWCGILSRACQQTSAACSLMQHALVNMHLLKRPNVRCCQSTRSCTNLVNLSVFLEAHTICEYEQPCPYCGLSWLQKRTCHLWHTACNLCDQPVHMQHHEGLANPLKLEVHDSREGSTDKLPSQAPQLYGLLRAGAWERGEDGVCLCIDDVSPFALRPKLACLRYCLQRLPGMLCCLQ